MQLTPIPWMLNADYLEDGIRTYVSWPWRSTMVQGVSGSGKSTADALLLAKVAKYCPDCICFVLDYKFEDFEALKGCARYYPYTAVEDGLCAVDAIYHARLSGEDTSKVPVIVYMDELAGFLASLDKKAADNYRRMMQGWLVIGRSIQLHCITSAQRMDSTLFSSGASREQHYVAVNMGGATTDAAGMVFPCHKDQVYPTENIGEGFMLVGGTKFYHIQCPFIRRQDMLVEAIRPIVTD